MHNYGFNDAPLIGIVLVAGERELGSGRMEINYNIEVFQLNMLGYTENLNGLPSVFPMSATYGWILKENATSFYL